MIEPNQRFYVPSGNFDLGNPSTFDVVDYDQRRVISVVMEGRVDSPEPAIYYLKKYIDGLGPKVYQIRLSSQGGLISTSSDPDDDMNRWVYYATDVTLERPKKLNTLCSRQNLKELDRLLPNVDLVSYKKSSKSSQTLVFKYYFLLEDMDSVWDELNLRMRLPEHESIVPFHSIVTDKFLRRPRIVGFTSVFIPRRTPEESSPSRPFKLRHLKQLTKVVDLLNLEHGIALQNINPGNLLISDATDELMISDFTSAVRIGEFGSTRARNDVDGVVFTLYEIITRDAQVRSIPFQERDVSAIENRPWVQHPDVVLDVKVCEFRAALSEWCENRREGKKITRYMHAPKYIDWPSFPYPHDRKLVKEEYNRIGTLQLPNERRHFPRTPLSSPSAARHLPKSVGLAIQEERLITLEPLRGYDCRRQRLFERGLKVIDWQRPASKQPPATKQPSASTLPEPPQNPFRQPIHFVKPSHSII